MKYNVQILSYFYVTFHMTTLAATKQQLTDSLTVFIQH